MPFFYILFYTILAPVFAQQSTENTINARLLTAFKVQSNRIKEASGIVASRVNKGVFWTHNDSGDSAVIFAVGADGSDCGRFVLKNCNPIDIEDIAVGGGPKPNVSYIYLGDIGDNSKNRTHKKIYRFEEPSVKSSLNWQQIDKYDVITFKYSKNKKYDAETLLLDPWTKDILIISKRGKKDKEEYDQVFKLNYPQQVSKLQTAVPECKIEVPNGFLFGYGITGGDISADGSQLIVKTYTNIYYWKRESNNKFSDFFVKPYIILPYTSQEGQGEAICFSVDGCYYQTIPEESLGEAYLSIYRLR